MPQHRGRITDVEVNVDTGWAKITVAPPLDGTPKGLQTARDEKIEDAAGFSRGGELLDITYSESESSRTNPHTGKPYLNRYYESATIVANGASGDDGITRVQSKPNSDGVDPGFGYRTYPDDAWRICLSVGLERAIEIAGLEEPRDLSVKHIWHLAYGLAVLLFTTPKPSGQALAESVEFGERPAGQREPQGEPPPYIDDDWPPR
jgi:hypothetical protein